MPKTPLRPRRPIAAVPDPITSELERQVDQQPTSAGGPIARMAQRYQLDSDRLLGLVLKLDFEESLFVTCDPWKRKCGGVPRGSFVDRKSTRLNSSHT